MSSRSASLISRANRILNSTNAFDRQVYLRVTTSSGGDPLIGRYGSLTVVDTLLSPQPFVERLGRERIPGGHANSDTVLIGSKMKLGDDYSVLVTASAISLGQLQNPQCQIVFKDTSGSAEVLSIHDFETVSIDSADVLYTVYCRSTKLS